MIDRRRFLQVSTLGLASTGGVLAQGPPPDGPAVEADEPVNRVLARARTDGRRLPAMLGAIVRGEGPARIGAVGVRKVGSPEPIRVGDLVHLGSCTKAMTATMIGTLVDEKKLRWDSTVAEACPDWAGQIHPEYAAVTLDQLIRHRAGLPPDFSWWDAPRGVPASRQRLDVLARGLRGKPASKPGSVYAYSNAGYVLAGVMAERAARASWESLMARRVFKPLGMASAGFGPPGTKGKVDQPWGHKATGDTVEAVYHDNPPVMGPAGTVHCSMADWARFASYHLRGGLGEARLFGPETLRVLHEPRPGEEYAGGWIACERSWAGGRALTHAGSNTYWFCQIWLAPARDLALLVATNAAGDPAQDACDQAVQGLLKLAEASAGDRPRRR